jgi:hypothetical protein
MRSLVPLFAALILICCAASTASAQEPPYFVTYDHYLEERGNLEIALATTTGLPRGDDHAAYTAPWLELEYGVTGWWTTELYVEGVTTRGDGRAFTGWRLENRFRPLRDEHRINPVLYFEYEHINEASRIQKEIVGSGGIGYEPIADLTNVTANELEAKLILSSAIGSWNLSENVIFEKNLSEDEGVEFGYSLGVSRSLGGLARGTACRVCAENFVLGVELYGGLGSTQGIARGEQRHYLAPVVGWQVGDHTTIKASTGFGLTDASDRYLLRVGVSYELPIGGRR